MSVCTAAISKRIVLARGCTVVVDAFRALSERSPFKVPELHVDNGDDILNEHLSRFLEQLHPIVRLSQGAPGWAIVIGLWNRIAIP